MIRHLTLCQLSAHRAIRLRLVSSLLLTILASVLLLPLSGCTPFTVINDLSAAGHYRTDLDISYGESARQKLDIYRPINAEEPAPLVIFFYGGGWDDGDKKNYEFVASSLTENGLVVVIPDYRLFPDVVFPDFVEDGATATAWAVRHAAEYGADSRQVYLMGHSAGAHIAALLANDKHYLKNATEASDGQRADASEPVAVAGFIGLSGPYDFLPIKSGYLLDVFPEETRAESQPINFVSAESPRTLLIHGNDDRIVEIGNSERFRKQLMSYGVEVEFLTYRDIGHVAVAMSLAPPLDFIATTLPDTVSFILEAD